MRIDQSEYVIFDVETTGLSPQNGDRIVEIGAVRFKEGKILETFESFINPLRDIPVEAQAIHKITLEMVKDAPTSKEVLPQVIDFIGGGCLVGHNVKFDLDFLCYELALSNRRLKDETPAIDTLKMAKKLFPHLRSYRLSAVASALGVSIEETHRALSDVKITAGILNRLLIMSLEQKIEAFNDFFKFFGVTKPNFRMEQFAEEFLF